MVSARIYTEYSKPSSWHSIHRLLCSNTQISSRVYKAVFDGVNQISAWLAGIGLVKKFFHKMLQKTLKKFLANPIDLFYSSPLRIRL